VVRLDTEYIERWSLWLDAKILALTLRKVYRELLTAMPEDDRETARSDSAET